MSLVLSAASTSAGPERGPLAGRRGRTGIDVLRPGWSKCSGPLGLTAPTRPPTAGATAWRRWCTMASVSGPASGQVLLGWCLRGDQLRLTDEQFGALEQGLPRQRLMISVL